MRRALVQGRIGKPLLAYAEADDDLIALAPVQLWKNLSGAPWPREDEFEVGCTLEHVGYYLTWLVFFFGPIAEVTAFAALQHPGKPVEPGAVEGPDFSVATLRFASGVAARRHLQRRGAARPRAEDLRQRGRAPCRGLLVLPDAGHLPALDAGAPAADARRPGATRCRSTRRRWR